MDVATWHRAKELLAAALTRPPDERRRFLAEACADPKLRAEVERLLHDTDQVQILGSLTDSGPRDDCDLPVLEPGTRIGHYVILEQVGAGGMGAVFLGRDTQLRRKVALKCLLSRGALPARRAQILREARAAARISHPNVAVVHDVVEQDERAFIVMEYVDGESLAARLRRGRIPIGAAISIARQLTNALSAAHARGVVHRDLKPANIQLTTDGTVKVLDFGVARELSIPSTASQARTSTGTAPIVPQGQPGTPPYMAPEQLLGDPADERSDIYSLGVLLYEMLVGHRPYPATDPAELLGLFTEPPVSPHDADARIPRALSDVVMRALDAHPAARFASAHDLGDALAPFDVRPGTMSNGSPQILAAVVRRYRWMVATALAILLLGAATISVLVRRQFPPIARRAPVIAVLPFTGAAAASSASLAAGVNEVLSASLASMPGVVAVSHGTSNGSAAVDGRKLAKELGLDYALAGAVDETASPRLVLTLTDVGRNTAIASRSFEIRHASAVPVLEEMAAWLIGELQKVVRSPEMRPPAGPTNNVQAFEDYSQGRLFLDRADVPGNVGRAIAALERAIERDSTFALAYAALGSAYWSQYYESRDAAAAAKAKDAALEALRLDPNQPLVRSTLANIYQGTGRKQEAIDELQKALKLQPSGDEAHRLLGQIYSDTGQVDKGVAELLTAIRLRPGFWGHYRTLGTIYYKAGRYQDAIATFSRLTELQPDSAIGFQLLGTSYHQIGDLTNALANYERANAIKPSPTAWSNIGTIAYREGRFADATAAYRKAIALRPKEPSSYRNLGDALLRADDRKGGLAAYRQAVAIADERLAIEKRDSALMAEKALCLAKTGAFVQARATIDAARAIAPSAEVLYQQAIIETLEGRLPQALATLRDAIEKGYSRNYAREDDEFVPLRVLPEFRQIVTAP